MKHVAQSVGRPTKGNEDQLFRRFRDAWNDINTEGVEIGDLVKFDYDNCPSFVAIEARKTLGFLTQCLEDKTFPREDYCELCQLAVVYLGGTVENFKFQLPGPVHHARFMARCLYYLKMNLLLNKTSILHQNEIREIQTMSEFIGIYYCLWWFKAPLSVKAASVDIEAIHAMRKYAQINPEVSKPCIESLVRHQWYLTQELAVICLADAELSVEVRKAVATALDETVR